MPETIPQIRPSFVAETGAGVLGAGIGDGRKNRARGRDRNGGFFSPQSRHVGG